MIAAVLALNAAIGAWQERKAEASVRALMGLVAPRARVRRDGREKEIDSDELVPGDLVLLQSGDRVPADLRLVRAQELGADESLLTGESVPVRKSAEPVDAGAGMADRTSLLYSGSAVPSGRGRGYVVATGEATELGKIAQQVRSEGVTLSPLQERMGTFAHQIGAAIGVAAVALFGLGLALGNPAVEMFMVAVALAVAAVPEGLPVVLTVALALGVRRMAKRNAILRRLAAVETLGSTSLIGSDKTGTLTENRMTVVEVWSLDGEHSLPGTFDEAEVVRGANDVPEELGDGVQRTLLAAVFANEASLLKADSGFELQGDPTETALLVAAARRGIDPQAAAERYESVREIPFESERRYAASVRHFDGEARIFVKGAPERVLDMCERAFGAESFDRDAVLSQAECMAARGLRVLALAQGSAPEGEGAPEGLEFTGLVGMVDPPRQGVLESIAGCQDAGIRVVMITGDHASTARAIANELGIDRRKDAPVLVGTDLEKLSDEELRERLPKVSVFARVAPEHKLRVVRAARDLGHVVAVTGDGVNDAPALKAADIGIAMGRTGTDVAREASDMVLADDNFVSIHAAVEEGRVTFDNVRKVTFFLVSTGAAAVVLLPLALILGLPLPLLPAQLLWLNLVTNGLQDVALAFEPAERGVLRRPPRPRQAPVVSRLLWERAGLAGLVMALGTLWLYLGALEEGRGEVYERTVALTALVVGMAFHVGNSRSERRSLFTLSPFSNPFLIGAQFLALLLHAGAMHFGPTQFVLRIEPLELSEWLRIAAVMSTTLVAVEMHKWLRKESHPKLRRPGQDEDDSEPDGSQPSRPAKGSR